MIVVVSRLFRSVKRMTADETLRANYGKRFITIGNKLQGSAEFLCAKAVAKSRKLNLADYSKLSVAFNTFVRSKRMKSMEESIQRRQKTKKLDRLHRKGMLGRRRSYIAEGMARSLRK
mmetsp:Transcript_41995/g.48329  ORF Transcript_41995/g.48329 Transcript_41995/m.48329 type:complete len:118 (-) Transcript_41995:110-463(-)